MKKNLSNLLLFVFVTFLSSCDIFGGKTIKVSTSNESSVQKEPTIVFSRDTYSYKHKTKYLLDFNKNDDIYYKDTYNYSFSLSNNTANSKISWGDPSNQFMFSYYRAYIYAENPGTTDLIVSYNGDKSKKIHFEFDTNVNYTVSFFDADKTLIQSSSQKYNEEISIPKIDKDNFLSWTDGNGFYNFDGTINCPDKDEEYYAVYGDDVGTDGLTFELKDDYYIVTGYKGIEYDVVIPAIYDGKYVCEIASGTFKNKSIESIKIPQTIKVIGSEAFYNTKLKKCEFNNTNVLKNIYADAFNSCIALETILIPKSVRLIDYGAFSNCDNLTILLECSSNDDITLRSGTMWDSAWNGNSTYYYNVKQVLKDDNYLYAKLHNNTILLLKYFGTQIFNETTIDGLYISRYGVSCFYNSSLEEIIISKIAVYIDSNCFYNCAKLKKVTFESESNIQVISTSAFRNCSALLYINIPKSITSIGRGAFYGCDNLTILFESENGDGISLPASSMYNESWNGSNDKYYFNVVSEPKLDSTGQFEYVEYNDGKIGILKYMPKQDYDIVNIEKIDGKDVKRVLLYAFNGTKVKKVICGSELESIYGYAFQNCEYLEEIDTTKSKKLTVIYAYAFSGCKRLEYFFIPNCVEKINSYAFDNCSNLTILFNSLDKSDITLASDYNPDGQREIFNVKSVDEKYINVSGSLKYYISNRNEVGIISYKGNNTSYDGYKSGPNIDLDFTNIDGMPIIEICDYAFSNLSADSNGPTIVTFTFGKSIKRIGYCAFYNLFNGDARSFKIVFEGESQLETIGSYAFCGHYASGVVVPKGVKTIGKNAFGLSTWANTSVIYMEKNDKSNMSLGSYWNGNQTVYWGNDWEYINGTPTLKQ